MADYNSCSDLFSVYLKTIGTLDLKKLIFCRNNKFHFDLCILLGSQTGKGGVCWNGHYCPEGTTTPLSCPQGTFSNVSNLDSCYTCPPGYYCVPGKRFFYTPINDTSFESLINKLRFSDSVLHPLKQG